MNRTHGVLAATVHGARHGLRWLSLLAISVSVGYAITVAVARVPATGGTTISWTAEAAMTSEAVDGFDISKACDTTGGQMLYVGLNRWIPAGGGVGGCPDGGS
jgi:hypothetical protein